MCVHVCVCVCVCVCVRVCCAVAYELTNVFFGQNSEFLMLQHVAVHSTNRSLILQSTLISYDNTTRPHVKQENQCTYVYKCNIEERSRNNCCCAKARIIKYSVPLSVTLVIQHVTSMHHIVICHLSGCTLVSTKIHRPEIF